MTLHVDNPDNLPEAEVTQYVRRAEDLISRGELPPDTCRLEVTVRGGEVDLRYYRDPGRNATPFNRIARITGYLVPDVRRWNSAKRAELRDRARHLSREVPL